MRWLPLALLLTGCFVPPMPDVSFPVATQQPPRITGVEGDGSALPVLEPADGLPLEERATYAEQRVDARLVLRGERLDAATEARLLLPQPDAGAACLRGERDPCVVHDASTGLVLAPADGTGERSISLPEAGFRAGLYVLMLVAPAGVAQAQVFVLQGEPGLDCWDLDEDRACDLPAEDADGDGTCTTLDCRSRLQCEAGDCQLDRNLVVSGDVGATGAVAAATELFRAGQGVGEALDDLDGRVAALEADPATGAQVGALDARVEALEANPATGAQVQVLESRVQGLEADPATGAQVDALDSRIAALEADPATGAQLAALDARLLALEADPATGTEVAALDLRLAALEADATTGAEVAALDARLAAIEVDFATASALGALEARVADVESLLSAGPSLAALDARLASVEADYATSAELAALDGRLALVEADFATGSALAALEASTAREIRTSATWTTPGDFPHVEDAWAELQGWRVHPDALLTIEVTGTHTMSGPLDLYHPDGARVRLIGGSPTAGQDVLDFGGSSGLSLARGHVRYLNNLTITGDGAVATLGVAVFSGATLALGPEVRVEGFDIGVQAVESSHVFARGVTVDSAADACFVAGRGASMDIIDAVGTGCGDGVISVLNSVVYAGGTSMNAAQYAWFAQSSAAIEASGGVGVSGSHCLFAQYEGFLRADGTDCTVDSPSGDSEGRAAHAIHGATVVATGGVLEAELGSVVYASNGATVIAWGGTTLRGNGPWLATAGQGSVVRAGNALLEGLASGGARAVGQSVVLIAGATPTTYPHWEEAGSLLVD